MVDSHVSGYRVALQAWWSSEGIPASEGEGEGRRWWRVVAEEREKKRRRERRVRKRREAMEMRRNFLKGLENGGFVGFLGLIVLGFIYNKGK